MDSVGIDDEDLFTATVDQLLSKPDEYEASEFCPYVDGRLIPDRLEQSFLKGNIHDIPIILGCTADEALSYLVIAKWLKKRDLSVL